MLEELQRHNYAETTARQYILAVEDFARRFNRPPDRLGPRHLREYQAELFIGHHDCHLHSCSDSRLAPFFMQQALHLFQPYVSGMRTGNVLSAYFSVAR
jgi:Phage integrase, N-terminal SAM-like domain